MKLKWKRCNEPFLHSSLYLGCWRLAIIRRSSGFGAGEFCYYLPEDAREAVAGFPNMAAAERACENEARSILRKAGATS